MEKLPINQIIQGDCIKNNYFTKEEMLEIGKIINAKNY